MLCKRQLAKIFIDNLLVRIRFIIVMIRWTGLAPLKFEFPFPGSLTSTFLDHKAQPLAAGGAQRTWSVCSASASSLTIRCVHI